MADEIKATEVVQTSEQSNVTIGEPVTNVEQKPEVKEAPKEDLISRVSKVKIGEVKAEPTNPFGLTKEDYDKVQNDPVLSKFYKSMHSDYIKKTQDLAEQRKQVQQPSTWTTERLQAELNKPDFIQAAQQVASLNNPPGSGLTNDEYSVLSDKEKQMLQQTQREVQNLKMQNWQMQQKQQDETLRAKYANYAPDIVDLTINKLMRNEVVANREDIWKVVDYDDMAKRAYELGKQDRIRELNEKQQLSSVEGVSATPDSSVPQIEKGESDTAYMKRLALRRLAQAQQGRLR